MTLGSNPGYILFGLFGALLLVFWGAVTNDININTVANLTPPHMVLAAYFCNWAIYGRNYTPAKLPIKDLTHIIYAFAKTDQATGTVSLSDPWADVDKQLDLGGKGCLGEFAILKKQNPDLRVLLSIGGWTYSADLNVAFADPAKIKTFALSAVKLMQENNLDGIDIDWEYPQNDQQAQQYVQVLAQVRLELDSVALRQNQPRNRYELSIAAPAGDPKNVLRVAEMDKYLTYWNLMTYDFSGSWSQTVDHQANLYGGAVSGAAAVDFYVCNGVAPGKIVLGMPLYGRSFANTGGLGQQFQGNLPGSFEQGVHDTKDLPLQGHKEFIDKERVGAYSQGQNQFITYDNKATMEMKADFCRQKGLAGGMWWESSGDLPGEKSLISAFSRRFRGHC